MKVLKFGGTSVGSSNNINKVIEILTNESKSSQLVVVVSAVGGITDKLLFAANLAVEKNEKYKNAFERIRDQHLLIVDELVSEDNSIMINFVNDRLNELKALLDGLFLINELSPKTTDKLLSFGELMSSFIITEAAKSKGLDITLKNSQDLIVTNNDHTNASIFKDVTNTNILEFFKSNHSKITLLPGFISKSKNGEITTLGRGGSDYTAAIVAACLDAEELQIWTDVSGMFTTNPKIVKQAKPISKISYQEAVELSHFGAKVLYPPTVQPVLDKNIPILIKNTMAPEEIGTRISTEYANLNGKAVKGISNIDDIALLTLQGNGMVGVPGFSKRLFETLSQEKINVIMITQASSEHSICIGVSESEADQAKNAIDETFENEISLHKLDPIVVEKGLAIVAVVGDNMKSHQGISGRMFSTLGKNNVNIRAIAQGASERNISAVIAKENVKKALNILHEQFFESGFKQINLFITGVGNVGEKLIDQIISQQEYVKNKHGLKLRIIGLSNSRKMIFSENGIDQNDWKERLKNGEANSPDLFLERVNSHNLRNSIFVDVTASKQVAEKYKDYLKESIAVVACNKIACSSDFENYDELKQLSRKYNAPFLFETNVGAGLPVIDTLKNLIASGDKIHSIQAVLSGSLNFIFNHFDENSSFHDVVKRAQDEGYTEPDPRIDLSGVDVARKLLILARESGHSLNMEDVENESFLTKKAMEANDVEDFYKTLISEKTHYLDLLEKANHDNCKLKFVAEFNEQTAKVGLQHIPNGHPFYNLEGKDNIVKFYTQRYPEQPLIVKGAGAGADVTASGLFADIIRAANN